jgi:hypothetical protein
MPVPCRRTFIFTGKRNGVAINRVDPMETPINRPVAACQTFDITRESQLQGVGFRRSLEMATFHGKQRSVMFSMGWSMRQKSDRATQKCVGRRICAPISGGSASAP